MVEFKIRKKCDFCGLEYWEDGRINKHYCISDSPTPPLMVDKCRDCKTISVLTDTIRILKTPMWFDRKPAETPPTTEKLCGNCDIVQSLIDMNEKLRKTVVIPTPTKPDEVVGKILGDMIHEFSVILRGEKLNITRSYSTKETYLPPDDKIREMTDRAKEKLIAWARSKAVEFVEIDTETIEMIAMKYLTSTKTPQWLNELLMEIFTQNPLKLKPK